MVCERAWQKRLVAGMLLAALLSGQTLRFGNTRHFRKTERGTMSRRELIFADITRLFAEPTAKIITRLGDTRRAN
jgi:hypothetical protein